MVDSVVWFPPRQLGSVPSADWGVSPALSDHDGLMSIAAFRLEKGTVPKLSHQRDGMIFHEDFAVQLQRLGFQLERVATPSDILHGSHQMGHRRDRIGMLLVKNLFATLKGLQVQLAGFIMATGSFGHKAQLFVACSALALSPL